VEITVPFFKLNIEAVQAGETPFWNPYAYGGTVHLAEPTSFIFYPVFLILSYIVSPEDNLFAIVKYVLIFHFFILATNSYLLGKYLKLSFWARIISATSFTFSCAIVCKWQYVIVICGLAWLPLVFLFFTKIYKSRTQKLSDVAKAGGCLALTFGAHAQYFFYTLLFLGLTLITTLGYRKYRNSDFTYSETVKKLIYSGLAVLLALLLLSVQILPTIEMVPYSTRASISYEFASDGSFQWKQFLTFFSPKLFGYYAGGEVMDFAAYFATPGKVYHYWETAYFFGVIPLIFGIFGSFSMKKSAIVVGCFFSCGIFILHALGSNAFLFKLLFQFPGFDTFRIPSRTLLYPVLCLSIASGFAIDKIITKKTSVNDKRLFYSICFVALLLSLYLMFGFSEAVKLPKEFHSTMLLWGIISFLLTLFAGFFFIARGRIKGGNWLYGFLAILVFTDLCLANKNYKNSEAIAKESMHVVENNLKALSSENNQINRYRPVSNRTRVFKRNMATYNGFHSMDGFYSFRIKPLGDLPKEWPTLDLMSVGIESDVPAEKGERRAFYQARKTALLHHRMTYNIDQRVANSITGKDIDFLNTTVLEKYNGPPLSGKAVSEVKHDIKMSGHGFERQSFDITTEEVGMLVLAEYWFPNWKAYLDGSLVEVQKANF
jgi:hypothetical protein